MSNSKEGRRLFMDALQAKHFLTDPAVDDPWAAEEVSADAIMETLKAQPCADNEAQKWQLTSEGHLVNSQGLCLTAGELATNKAMRLAVEKCTGDSHAQHWHYLAESQQLVLESKRDACLYIEKGPYRTLPGAKVWLAKSCTDALCGRGDCAWQPKGSIAGSLSSAAQLGHVNSALCFDDGSIAPAVLPRTCAEGSVAKGMDFCDSSKSFKERARLLVKHLSLEEKIGFFMVRGMLSGLERLNIKAYSWDNTDSNGGISPQQSVSSYPDVNNTVFPNAIGLGASFDLSLIKEVSAATAAEARALEDVYYQLSSGSWLVGGNFDGGPLANLAYDPRIGRSSEMYGEDPYHVSRIGVVATRTLQNRTGDGFLQTSQVTRHFITDHASQPDNIGGNFTSSLMWLEDTYLPPFEAFQVEGMAEGIMFSIGSLNGDTSVTSEFLFEKLKEWDTTCFAQTDCCGTFYEAVNKHKTFSTQEEAVSVALERGIHIDYGDDVASDIQNAIENGRLPAQRLDEAVTRMFLTRFRLGEFDESPHHPFLHRYPASILGSEAHRDLARRAMSASVVLLQNRGVLPLQKQSISSIAVIGPFADCHNRDGGYGGKPGYLHSYNGQPSHVSTILEGIQEHTSDQGIRVIWESYAKSCEETLDEDSINKAVAIAADAEVVVLALGLGDSIEKEFLDRTSLQLPDTQKALLKAVTDKVRANGRKSILVLNSGSGIDIDRNSADAILEAWYGGQETGRGLADVLFGVVNPSGRLPLTVHREAYLDTIGDVRDLSMVFPQRDMQGRTYRYLRDQAKDALFSFGWGLSYTTFEYSKLQTHLNEDRSVDIEVTVTNTGSRAGAEVSLVFLTIPSKNSKRPTPQYSLQGFEKLYLNSGESRALSFSISPRQQSTALEDGSRAIQAGQYSVSVAGHLPSDPRAAEPESKASNVVTGTWQQESTVVLLTPQKSAQLLKNIPQSKPGNLRASLF